jgi:hypothetical protein
MTCKVISIDGIDYVRKDSIEAQLLPGKRAVVVVDRGWVFAGDVTEKDGRIILSRALWILRWDSVGFDGMIKDPKTKVTIRTMPSGVDLPKDAELFRVPVSDSWGL